MGNNIKLTPETRQLLRNLVDRVWNVVTESTAVPSYQWSDDIIDAWVEKENAKI